MGNDLAKVGNTIRVSTKKYVNETLRKYQEKYGQIPKQNTPMAAKEHPELDTTPLCNDKDHNEYQHIIGVCQWLIVAGRFDLCYAVSLMSRYSAAPREGHLLLA